MEVSYFFIAVVVALIISGLTTAMHLISFVVRLNPGKKDELSVSDYLPKCAIILCLRGEDPFLSKCIQSLVSQDYPNFKVILVVDNPVDNALNAVNPIVKQYGPSKVLVSFLENVQNSCSLKCSALVQAVSGLDSSYEVVAFADADITAPTTWLRELVTPLKDPQIAVTTGNRWYVPTGECWGTLMRYLWNIHVSSRMALYDVVWGGSFAIKTQILRQTGIADYWSKSFSDDLIIGDIIKPYGYRVKFVPSALMLNCEETQVLTFVSWIKRQHLCGSLYRKFWLLNIAEGVLFPLPLFMLIVYAFYNVLQAQWITALTVTGLCIALIFVITLSILVMEKYVQEVTRHQCEAVSPLPLALLFKVMVSLLPTMLVILWAALASTCMKTVNWRGVSYVIKGPWDIRLVQYKPYELDKRKKTLKCKLSL